VQDEASTHSTAHPPWAQLALQMESPSQSRPQLPEPSGHDESQVLPVSQSIWQSAPAPQVCVHVALPVQSTVQLPSLPVQEDVQIESSVHS
jgi:hypothetical protein